MNVFELGSKIIYYDKEIVPFSEGVLAWFAGPPFVASVPVYGVPL